MLGKIPANRLYRIGPEHPEHVPDAELTGDVPAGPSNYNYQITRPSREHPRLAAGDPRRLPADAEAARERQVLRLAAAQDSRSTARCPGFNDTQMQNPVVSTLAFTVNYSLNPTTFLEGTYGRSRNELAGCALAQSGTGPIVLHATPSR